MEYNSLLIRQREDGRWEEKPEPYAIIECEKQEDFNYLKHLLESTRWIPVEEGLPPDNLVNPITRDAYVYPVTVDLGGVTDIRYYSFWHGHWYNQGPETMDDLVIAWMPIPDPYQPDVTKSAQHTISGWKERMVDTFNKDSEN